MKDLNKKDILESQNVENIELTSKIEIYSKKINNIIKSDKIEEDIYKKELYKNFKIHKRLARQKILNIKNNASNFDEIMLYINDFFSNYEFTKMYNYTPLVPYREYKNKTLEEQLFQIITPKNWVWVNMPDLAWWNCHHWSIFFKNVFDNLFSWVDIWYKSEIINFYYMYDHSFLLLKIDEKYYWVDPYCKNDNKIIYELKPAQEVYIWKKNNKKIYGRVLSLNPLKFSWVSEIMVFETIDKIDDFAMDKDLFSNNKIILHYPQLSNGKHLKIDFRIFNSNEKIWILVNWNQTVLLKSNIDFTYLITLSTQEILRYLLDNFNIQNSEFIDVNLISQKISKDQLLKSLWYKKI